MCSRRFEENTTTRLSTRFHLGVPQLGVNADLKKERGDERIREHIPVPDTLGKETFLVGIYTSRGNLKDQ